MLYQLPRTSRVFKKIEPATEWGYEEIFLNKVVHLLETIVWQNSTPTKKAEQAKHKAQKPELFTPEFMKKHNTPADVGIKKDTVATDVDTVKELLARPRG